MNKYRPRIADILLEECLEAFGAVLIEGAKACGKSTTAKQQAKSVLIMDDPKERSHYQELANTDITILLNGKTPRLIDEWQLAPKFWDAIRYVVDVRGEEGQFILTGSAVPAKPGDKDEMTHTGTGRYARLRMRPMTLWESGESNGGISLEDLFCGKQGMNAENNLSLEQVAFLTCRGGWPNALGKRTERASLLQAKEYVKSIVESDISRVDGVERNPDRALNIMRSYARNIASQASVGTIADDISGNEGIVIGEKTIVSYINALRQIFVIEDSKAWNPNLRSKTAIRTTDTRYFVDPSVGIAAMGLSPKDLINDMNTFGFFFENLVVRDLRVYAELMGGKVEHYRDKNNLECDIVVRLPNGKYGLIEVKLGSDKGIQEGIASLSVLSRLLDMKSMPAFRAILTATGRFAYQREDGIYIIPVGCLRP
ncbi:MAG: ATP-binding protein [Marinilabiliaceae bacterium]|nr:ATP-binding protein [Marinilabiliaceae bacterium]